MSFDVQDRRNAKRWANDAMISLRFFRTIQNHPPPTSRRTKKKSMGMHHEPFMALTYNWPLHQIITHVDLMFKECVKATISSPYCPRTSNQIFQSPTNLAAQHGSPPRGHLQPLTPKRMLPAFERWSISQDDYILITKATRPCECWISAR